MGWLIGIDLGTSSVKMLIMNSKGNVVSSHKVEYPILTPREGYAEQDPISWWNATAAAIRVSFTNIAIKPSDICCIGFSGQMHGTVILDKSGGVIRPAIIWCDQRTQEEIQQIYELVGRETVGRITHNPLFTGFQLPSLLWIKHHEPENYRRIGAVICPKDYIRYKLTGVVCSEISDASSTLCFDIVSQQWSEEILTKADIDTAIFPTCKKPTEIIGSVHKQGAVETGLAEGTPVIAGGSDQPMQAIGNGITTPGIISSTIGTGGQLYSLSYKPIYNPEMNTHTFCGVIPGAWYVMAATLSAGLSLSWLRTNILGDCSYAIIDKEALDVPAGSEGLIFLPYLAGERTPHLNPNARGLFYGLTLKHSRSHFSRAVMEGVVFSLKDCLMVLNKLGIHISKIVASGGGSHSDLWLQIQADIFGMEIYTATRDEQAGYGAAIAAGVGVGIYSDIENACKAIIPSSKLAKEPNKDAVPIYQESYALYRNLYQNNIEFMKQ